MGFVKPKLYDQSQCKCLHHVPTYTLLIIHLPTYLLITVTPFGYKTFSTIINYDLKDTENIHIKTVEI